MTPGGIGGGGSPQYASAQGLGGQGLGGQGLGGQGLGGQGLGGQGLGGQGLGLGGGQGISSSPRIARFNAPSSVTTIGKRKLIF